MSHYWNHNTAFHDELVADAKKRGGRMLDIGCGDGLLIQRLAPHVQEVVGIDPDPEIIARAHTRLASMPNVLLIEGDFLTIPPPVQEKRFDTIICVATLHHMDLRAALLKIRQFLAPGGRLLVIGLSANKTFLDYLLSGLFVFPIRIMDRIHGGMQDIGVRLADPKESLSEIRRVANEVLPVSVARRRFYYRYLLYWDNPTI